MNIIYPKNLSELQRVVASCEQLVVCGSKTSTVMNWHQQSFKYPLIDLSCMEKGVGEVDDGWVEIRGSVTWQDLIQAFPDFIVPSCPTDKNALVLSGIATGCSGENSFRFGAIGRNVSEISFLDPEGRERIADSNLFSVIKGVLQDCRVEVRGRAHHFKRAPFIDWECGGDVLVGSEGELGIISGAKMKLHPRVSTVWVRILLPSWRESSEAHEELFDWVNKKRNHLICAEFFDGHWEAQRDQVYLQCEGEELLDELCTRYGSDAAVVDESKFHRLRSEIPLKINEKLMKNKMRKWGTDIQMPHIRSLFERYRELCQVLGPVENYLFGHFGDAHLHFNVVPSGVEEVEKYQLSSRYDELYEWASKEGGSPFAEHGLGLLKKYFFKKSLKEREIEVYKKIKKHFDPHFKFFPEGKIADLFL